ncbi:HNH endonuclease, partial [Burkholderia multivorans]
MEAESLADVLADIVRWREALSALPPARTEREAIDRITALEELASAAAAAQARETLTFDMHRRNREAEDGVPSDRQGRGVGAEIGLARKFSRARGSRFLGFSRTLLMDLPHTYAALRQGEISEEKARLVATETAW